MILRALEYYSESEKHKLTLKSSLTFVSIYIYEYGKEVASSDMRIYKALKLVHGFLFFRVAVKCFLYLSTLH